MDNSINALQEQVDSQVADPTCKTSTEKSKTYSEADLISEYEKEFTFEENPEKLH